MFSILLYFSKDENSQIRKKVLQALSYFLSHPIPGIKLSKIEPIAFQALGDPNEEVKNIAYKLLEKLSEFDSKINSKEEVKIEPSIKLQLFPIAFNIKESKII